MKMKAGLVVVVAIAAVIMFSSYAAAEEQLSQEELEELMFANATKVNTYKFEYAMNMTLEMSMFNETNVTELMVMAMVGNGSGVVDNINKSMMMAMNMCVNMSEIMEVNTSEDTNGNASENTSLDMPETICVETEMYLINNTMYMKMDLGIPLMPAQWMKMELPVENETYWEAQDQLYPQMELLNASKVLRLEDEEVKGADCYVIKIEPDIEKFWEIAMNQTMGGLPGFDNPMNNSQETETGNVTVDNGNATGISYSDFVNLCMMNISITDWIAKDTKFMMKEQMTMDMTISLENLDIPDTEGGITMTIDFEMISYDYNKPVSIVLPEEAEDAIEVPTERMLPGIPAMPGTRQIVPAIV